MSRQSCVVCAWRATCAKRFSVSDGGARCPDFSRDITIKDLDEESASASIQSTKETPLK
jgi:hypothetical protein